MSAQVFISYSNQDRAVAEGIHDALEKAGIPAWLAHRDLTSGVPWSQRIIDEIHASRVMILILSRHANESQYVIREVGEAVERQTSIVTVRIEDIAPSKGLKFFIGAEQWLDAFLMPKERYHKRLVEDVRLLLGTEPVRRSDAPAPIVLERAQLAPATRAATTASLPGVLREHRRAVRATLGIAGSIALVFAGMKVLPAFRPDVMIATAPGQLYVGDTLQLALSSEHDSVTWSSGSPEVIGIAPGEVTFRALSAGNATLYARARGSVDSVLVTVLPPPVASIDIQPPPASLRVGDSHQFVVMAKDAHGRDLAVVDARWSSETPQLVSISEQGSALGVAAGRGRVRVRVDSLVRSAPITVVAATVRGDPARSNDSSRIIAADPQRTRDSTPVEPPARPSLPSAAELTRWADLCLKMLSERNASWLEANYHASIASDRQNLEDLKSLLTRRNYRLSGQEVSTPQPADQLIDFRAEFTFSRFTGGAGRASATFRVLAVPASGVWRLGSCRVAGSIAGL